MSPPQFSPENSSSIISPFTRASCLGQGLFTLSYRSIVLGMWRVNSENESLLAGFASSREISFCGTVAEVAEVDPVSPARGSDISQNLHNRLPVLSPCI